MANSISAGTQTICGESKEKETQSQWTHFLLHELEWLTMIRRNAKFLHMRFSKSTCRWFHIADAGSVQIHHVCICCCHSKILFLFFFFFSFSLFFFFLSFSLLFACAVPWSMGKGRVQSSLAEGPLWDKAGFLGFLHICMPCRQ